MIWTKIFFFYSSFLRTNDKNRARLADKSLMHALRICLRMICPLDIDNSLMHCPSNNCIFHKKARQMKKAFCFENCAWYFLQNESIPSNFGFITSLPYSTLNNSLGKTKIRSREISPQSSKHNCQNKILFPLRNAQGLQQYGLFWSDRPCIYQTIKYVALRKFCWTQSSVSNHSISAIL